MRPNPHSVRRRSTARHPDDGPRWRRSRSSWLPRPARSTWSIRPSAAGMIASGACCGLARRPHRVRIRSNCSPFDTPTDPDGAFTVTGLVQNPIDGRLARHMVAVVYLFDRDGNYFASGKATLDFTALQPGEESPFVVHIPGVGRCQPIPGRIPFGGGRGRRARRSSGPVAGRHHRRRHRGADQR